jgi:hypothetical protein
MISGYDKKEFFRHPGARADTVDKAVGVGELLRFFGGVNEVSGKNDDVWSFTFNGATPKIIQERLDDFIVVGAIRVKMQVG